MWALWPVRGIGGIVAVLSLLMIAATPVIGAHFIIDVAAGAALAAASIWAAKFYLDRSYGVWVRSAGFVRGLAGLAQKKRAPSATRLSEIRSSSGLT
ncbi:phosphatase PAP2 family protein [Bradyrhizobium sp. ERR14]|uniref:phosphatase PAP2 family protein n=1 Tax=Bradyrhizobium sp. ERR14 TaxID=2663837 RepID=UPI001FEEE65C|nr:phosphatase PAP2 family protein [Bradyrhizobium sp. ERR14]